MTQNAKWAIYAICAAAVLIAGLIAYAWWSVRVHDDCLKLRTERAQIECIHSGSDRK